MVYHRATIAKFHEDDDAFQLKQNIMLLAGVVILLISGVFVFLFKPLSQKQTVLCISMFAICMAMIFLATIIMVLAICRIFKELLPAGQRNRNGFSLKKCIALALSYSLFLICYIFFVLNATVWGL